MKLRRMVPVLLSLALLASLLTVPALAADATLPLREDWRLTSDLDLNDYMTAGTTLVIDGQERYHIYEMGGKLTNSGQGIVQLAEGTILYPAAGDADAGRFTAEGIWDTKESNALMALRAGAYGVQIEANSSGTVTTDKLAAREGERVNLTATPNSGYTLDSLTCMGKDNQAVAVTDNYFIMPDTDVVVRAVYTAASSSSGGGGGGGSQPTTTTTTTNNPDGSTTTTVTNTATGTVTETTQYPDGSQVVVETKKDGTVTTTATDAEGSKTQTVEQPDGSAVTTVERADGSSAVVQAGAGGVTARVALSQAALAAARDAPAALPIPALSASSDRTGAPSVTLDLPTGTQSAQVEIPVENVTPGTVAVLVGADGTETVIKTSLTTENGVAVTLNDGDTVKIVDNTKTFADVPDSYWGAQAVAFAASRELFAGTGGDTFSPDAAMTRAMFVTVLARFEGVDTSVGTVWYEAGAQWAMDKGISDGTNLDQSLTREQLATMLYRYVGQPDTSGSLDAFPDGGQVSGFAAQAMSWAVETGLIGGTGAGTLNPQGEASRAEVATILQRFCQAQAG